MQRASHEGEHLRLDVSRLDLRHDVGLKLGNQLVRLLVTAIGAIAQKVQQPLQHKQIAERQRLVLAARRHVAGRAGESGKDFTGRGFAVAVQIVAERRRFAFGDRARNPARVLIGGGEFWLRVGHRAASTNQRDSSAKP